MSNQITREEKIEKIYEFIANKELSFGCVIKIIPKDVQYPPIAKSKNFIRYGILLDIKKSGKLVKTELWIEALRSLSYEFIKIWHPVMIWDVLDWIEKENNLWDSIKEKIWIIKKIRNISIDICNKWEHKIRPIEEQSDECIYYIYNLLTNDQYRTT